ncbi:MAG: hemerythrin domain-containing protein [Dehalococcoidia bacterium]
MNPDQGANLITQLLVSVTAELEAEHRVIQKVVGVMAALRHDIADGDELNVTALRNVVEFMRVFGDELHHGKEEEILFPALEAAGVPVKGCPIGTLRAEHAKGREMISSLAEAIDDHARGETAARDAIAGMLDDLMEFYPRHIWKEDYLAFPMSDKILTDEVKAEVTQGYQAVDDRLGQVRARMEQLAETLYAAHHAQ